MTTFRATTALLLGLLITTTSPRLIAGQGSGGAAAAMPAETQAERDARMGWWRDARFGMFIHWGLYAVPAGE